jgi:hypothetical protein
MRAVYLQLAFFRFCCATFAACFPNAVRTDFGKWAIVRFFFAAAAAFLTFRRAAFRCFVLAIGPPECPIDAAHNLRLAGSNAVNHRDPLC